MARFLFASHARLGHIDLGGRSYLRTAVALKERGHDVRWVTTSRHEPVEAAVEAAGIQLVTVSETPLKLGADHDPAAIARSVTELTRYLDSYGADALAADRILANAHLAARLAGIPWTAFGTDGHSWRRARVNGSRVRQRGVHEKRAVGAEQLYGLLGLPANDDGRVPPSVWLRSPFLTISFFPAELWHDDAGERLPQAHFLGCAGRGSREESTVPRLVVSGGNTWTARAARATAAALSLLRGQLPGLEVEFLTGRAELTAELRARAELTGVSVTTWADYGEAFRGARLAVGHGGTAFLWQSMAEGAPVLVVDPAKGDQTANAARVETLGIGCVLREDALAPERVAEAILAGLGDDASRDAMQAFSRLLRTGGGYDAAATLLETLAAARAPITECPATPCCCTLPDFGHGATAATGGRATA